MAQFAVPIAIALVATAAVFILTKPKGTHTKGPRLGDLKVTDSAYGKPIPILRGRGRAGGNIIQASDLRQIPHTEKVEGGGKGGSSSSKQTTYTAEVDFALMIGEGEIDKLLRIWFDGKIVFDITGTAGLVKKPGLIFRFYKGTEDQLPDPLIEALVGENLAPAYRGVAYIIFEKLQLADYGNRPPQVTVEYAEVSTPLQLFKVIAGNQFSEPFLGLGLDHSRNIAINELTRKAYILGRDNASTPDQEVLIEFDIDSMLVTRYKYLVDIIDVAPGTEVTGTAISGYGTYDDRIYVYLPTALGNRVVAINSLSFIQEHSLTMGGGEVAPKVTQIRTIQVPGGPLFLWNIYTSSFSSFTGVTVSFDLVIDPGSSGETHFGAIPIAALTGPDHGNILAVEGKQTLFYRNEAWLIFGGRHPELTATQAQYTADLSFGNYDCISNGNVISLKQLSITHAMIDPAASSWAWGSINNLIYIVSDDTCVALIDVFTTYDGVTTVDNASRRCYAVKISTDDTPEIIWSVQVPTIVLEGADQNLTAKNTSGIYGYVHVPNPSPSFSPDYTNQKIVMLNVITGTYEETAFTSTHVDFINTRTFQYWDESQESILTTSITESPGGTPWVKLYPNRAAAAGVSVADIVRQFSLRAGLQESEFDVTDITGANFEVGGFQATQPSTARANIEPLEVAFSFYSVESDYVIKFIPKDGAIAPVEIAERFLVQDNESDVLEERRVQELDLPAYVGITFMDQDRDYNTGTAQSKRPSNPSSTMLSDNRVEVELPIVWDYTSVKRISQRSLYSAWQERVNYKGRMAWDFLYIDPGEEIIVNLDNGDILPQRIEKQAIGADLVMEFEAVSSDVATYSSTIDGDGGIDPIRKTFPQSNLSRLFVLDMPLLLDVHNPASGLSMEYYGLAGYGVDDWRGAILFKSSDNLNWTEITDTVLETSWGTINTALPDNLDPFATDYDLQIEVYMVTQSTQMQSITYTQFLNGENAAAVVKGNGEIEVIQFQTVVDDGDGKFTLSGIARGRRGTNVFCNNHTTSELFILLRSDIITIEQIAVSQIGSPFYYKAVTIGTLLSDAPVSTFTTQGNDLKPYMPTHFTATVVATDIQFEWVRNTRIGGALMDGTGEVPLSEDSELYDLEIFDGPGGTLVRTFSGMTTPSKLYLNADIITDFGSIPSSITFKIYQISALVGRGLSRELTAEVV